MGISVWCLIAPMFLASVRAGLHDIVAKSFYEEPQYSSPAPVPSQSRRPELRGMKEIVLFLTPDQVETLEAAGAVVQPFPEYDNNFSGLQEQLRQSIEQQQVQQYPTWMNPIEDQTISNELQNYYKLLNIQKINDDLSQVTQVTEGITEPTTTPRYKYTKARLQYKEKEYSTPYVPKKPSRTKISNQDNGEKYIRFLPNYEHEMLQMVPFQALPIFPYQFDNFQTNVYIQANEEGHRNAYSQVKTIAQPNEFIVSNEMAQQNAFNEANTETQQNAFPFGNTGTHEFLFLSTNTEAQKPAFNVANTDDQQSTLSKKTTEAQRNAYSEEIVGDQRNVYLQANTKDKLNVLSQVNTEAYRNALTQENTMAQQNTLSEETTETQRNTNSQGTVEVQLNLFPQVNKKAKLDASTTAQQNTLPEETTEAQRNANLQGIVEVQQNVYTQANTKPKVNEFNQINTEANRNAYPQVTTDSKNNASDQNAYSQEAKGGKKSAHPQIHETKQNEFSQAFTVTQRNAFSQTNTEAQPAVYQQTSTEGQQKVFSQASTGDQQNTRSKVNTVQDAAKTVTNEEAQQNVNSRVNAVAQQTGNTVANTEAQTNTYTETTTKAQQNAYTQINRQNQRNVFKSSRPSRVQVPKVSKKPQRPEKVQAPMVTTKPTGKTYFISQGTREFKETLSSIEGLPTLTTMPPREEQQEKPETPAPPPPTVHSSILHQDQVSLLLAPLYQHQTITDSISRQKEELLKSELNIRTKLRKMKESPQYYDQQEYTAELEKLTRNFQQQNAFASIEASTDSNTLVNQGSQSPESYATESVRSTEIPMFLRTPKPHAVNPLPVEFMRPFRVSKPVVARKRPDEGIRNVYVKVDKPFTTPRFVPIIKKQKIPVMVTFNPDQLSIIRHIWEH